MAILHLTGDNFDQTIKEGTCLVDFWAGWCGPCRMIAPTIEALDAKLGAGVKVCKVDVDANQELSARFGVMSIPTVIVFENGEEKNRAVGLQSQSALEAML